MLCITLCLAPPALALEGRLHVIDGDTFDVGDTRVRLHGVDAPERDQTCNGPGAPGWSCGQWVTEEVRARYEGRAAVCEARDIDRYGRTVARCAVGGQDMGEALVTDGLLFAYERYSMDYVAAEKAALVAGRGLHGMGVQDPARHRAAQRDSRARESETLRQVKETVSPGWRKYLPKALRADCVIKGNISMRGEKIYHVPGQENYAETRISRRDGEKWFCSETEARAAGWRRAQR